MKKDIFTQLFWVCFHSAYGFVCDYFVLSTIVRCIRRYKLVKLKHVIILIFILLIINQILLLSDLNYLKLRTTPTPPIYDLHKLSVEKILLNSSIADKNNSSPLKIPSEAEFRMNLVKNKLQKLAKQSERWDISKQLSKTPLLHEPCMTVHIFYYTFYQNLNCDGKWTFWNQEYLNTKSGESRIINLPPLDIRSNFYPLLGCYSSKDVKIIETHLKQIHDTGIGVVVASWFIHKGKPSPEEIFGLLLDIADKYKLKVAPHIEVYEGCSIEVVERCLINISDRYSAHTAFYKIEKNGRYLPVYYIYESYQIPALSWRELLARDGSKSIRGTQHDGVFVGLLLGKEHKYHIDRSQFDGFYTYFSSNGFSFGSSWKNWKTLQSFAEKHKLLFFPSVGPGYIDTHSRPWNSGLTRHRSRGHYYQIAWRSAMAAKPYGVSITSFNNWQDGTQIEPASPKLTPQFVYLNYEPEGPFFYLNLTRYWIKQFTSQDSKSWKF